MSDHLTRSSITNETGARTHPVQADRAVHSTAVRPTSNPLPTGTITFLFTDIEGSTPLWEQHPRQMAEALQVHHAALRQAIEAESGVVFKTVGDAFQAAFARAPQALRAAIQAQRLLQSGPWNDLGPLKVRMGLHTGEAELDPGGDEYAVSHTKNRAARIMSAAHGGQILLSAETAELVDHQLPPGVSLKDLGEHRLKGMLQPEHIFQAAAPGLPADFPPLKSDRAPQHNLPLQLSSFIGREKEMAAVKALLGQARLLTLSGVGGAGKTRLSLAVASQLIGEFEHGVWLVELAPLGDPALIAATVASLFGLRSEAGSSPLEMLTDYLRSKRLLLVLDNCEHLIVEAARFADTVLRLAPQVKVLATSREALGLAGETVYLVPSLETPEPLHLPPAPSLLEFDAVRLFVERARAAQPAFILSEQNAPAVALICQRLDGIPLAIELAAARVKVLPAEHIAARLDDRFRLLTGGSRTALPRHQTLHALIEWSYGLLTETERKLYRCLSVFRGGWRLEAAEALCPCGKEPAIDVLETLAGLVNKSLIQTAVSADGLYRYRMLETIRQYAQEKLLESGEAEEMRGLHLAYYADFAEAMEKKLHSPGYLEALEKMDVEIDNHRAALDWALGGSPALIPVQGARLAQGLRLAAALAEYWYFRGLLTEGLGWLDKIAAIPGETESLVPLRARVYFNYWHLWVNGDAVIQRKVEQSVALYRKAGDQAGLASALIVYGGMVSGATPFSPQQSFPAFGIALIQEGIALSEALGDPVSLGWAYYAQGYLSSRQNDFDASRRAMERSIACFEGAGDLVNAFYIREQLADNAFEQGVYDTARRLYEQCLEFSQGIGNQFTIVYIIAKFGLISYCQGDFAGAEARIQESLARADEMGVMFMGVVWLKRMLAGVALRLGQRRRARQLFLDSQALGHKLMVGDQPGDPAGDLAFVLWMGCLAEASGQPELSARFLGAVEAILETFFKPLDFTPEKMEYDRLRARLSLTLEPAAFTAAWAEGRKLSLGQALDEALEYCRNAD